MIFVMPGGSQVGRLTISHLINRDIDPSKIGAGARSPSKIADRKSTRLNSSHTVISYAVFCLKKKKSRDNNSFRVCKRFFYNT